MFNCAMLIQLPKLAVKTKSLCCQKIKFKNKLIKATLATEPTAKIDTPNLVKFQNNKIRALNNGSSGISANKLEYCVILIP